LYKGVPIEIKTTRFLKDEIQGLPPQYVRQLAYYSCLLGVNEGFLVLVRVTAPSLKTFRPNFGSSIEKWKRDV